MLSLHFFFSIFEGVFGVRDRNSIDAYVCAPEDARTHFVERLFGSCISGTWSGSMTVSQGTGERGRESDRD